MNEATRQLEARLEQWDHFEECLLHDLRLTRHGFSAEVTFNVIHDVEGRVRDDVLEQPRLVTIRVDRLASLGLVGGLPPGLEGDAVNWGLSEVALVQAYDAPGGVGLRLLWEGERRIELEGEAAVFP